MPRKDKYADQPDTVNWKLMGFNPADYEGPIRPSVRLDIPLPPDEEKLYEMLHRLKGLFIRLDEGAQRSIDYQYKVGDVQKHVRFWNQGFAEMRAKWKAEALKANGEVN